MYAKLTGKIEEIFDEFIILNLSGVGYRVETPNKNYLEGQETTFYVYTYVREQDIRLFGFDDRQQYLLFMDLITISGIGPKSALLLLSSLSVNEILTAIESKESKEIEVKGVGKKSAQRIVIEMANKLEKYSWDKAVQRTSSKAFSDESRQALLNLGFAKNEIDSILRSYKETENPEKLEEIVKYALKFINSSNKNGRR